MAKNDINYFDSFKNMFSFSQQAAAMLNETLKNYDPRELEKKINEIHEVEHGGDNAKHMMMKALSRSFVTPIEREDIMQLSQNIDDVTDTIEDVVIKMYIYNITTVRPEAISFSELLVRICAVVDKLLGEFHNFKKSTTLHDLIVEVSHLEEEGDQIYKDAMRRLFTSTADPIEIIRWRELFNVLEACCDACEHVADVVESAWMKNS